MKQQPVSLLLHLSKTLSVLSYVTFHLISDTELHWSSGRHEGPSLIFGSGCINTSHASIMKLPHNNVGAKTVNRVRLGKLSPLPVGLKRANECVVDVGSWYARESNYCSRGVTARHTLHRGDACGWQITSV